MSRFVPFWAREKSPIAKLLFSDSAASPFFEMVTPVVSTEESDATALETVLGTFGVSTSPSASSANATPNGTATENAIAAAASLARSVFALCISIPHYERGWAHNAPILITCFSGT